MNPSFPQHEPYELARLFPASAEAGARKIEVDCRDQMLAKAARNEQKPMSTTPGKD
jgi:hypothetical protein